MSSLTLALTLSASSVVVIYPASASVIFDSKPIVIELKWDICLCIPLWDLQTLMEFQIWFLLLSVTLWRWMRAEDGNSSADEDNSLRVWKWGVAQPHPPVWCHRFARSVVCQVLWYRHGKHFQVRFDLHNACRSLIRTQIACRETSSNTF